MSKLQLLITQYREDETIIKNMLNSIQSQINVDLSNDIEVFIGNDGSDKILSENFLKQYSFPIQYHMFEHSRIAGCRKRLFDLATAEYVMFCDGDDMFINDIALSLIFREMENPFDCLNCDFYRESKDENNNIKYNLFTNNDNEVHGLVLRRQFLLDNKIEWHSELYEFQSIAYVAIVKILAKERHVLNSPIYLCKYYDNSISHQDGKYHRVFRWPHYIDVYDALISDLLYRGISKHAKFYTLLCLHSSYLQLTDAKWYEEQNEIYKSSAYKRIADFYRKYHLLLTYTDDEITKKAEDMALKSFNKIERNTVSLPSIEEWLQSILNLYL